ncbi:MAG: hypothetical protein IKH29_02430 [Methanobrevibacter sp.]|uniref:DUF5655 domain-containing protein n=1 Tax=Methanobrevibacter sp. TaxID=66852 RepID=UPI0025FDD593|nr:DUF5655 domain-containing protein [Methanobrevibacter sp.]MBR3112554.1 hypothetical protein [Methanobrevibacter sp.]
MTLYQINKNNLEPIRKINFKYEKDLQKLTEKNLDELFNLEFVETEFTVDNLRIDTLCFNKESNSFVIIEYKKGKNYSVIDQGYSYLSILLNNKAEFVLKYNENLDANLKKSDVDWSQSIVIFIAPEFTPYQLKSIEFNDLAFELWEVSKFSNDTILFDKVNVSEDKESINTVTSKNTKVNKEIKKYKESTHLRKKSKKVKEIYSTLKEKILEYNDIEIVPLKHYIAFKLNKKNVCEITLQKNYLNIWIDLDYENINDSLNRVKNVSDIGHWGTGNSYIQINEIEDISYFMELFKQSYEDKL